MISYDKLSDRFLTVSDVITRDGQKNVRLILDTSTNFFYTLDDNDNFIKVNQPDGFVFIQTKSDFPSSENGIISLESNITYFITKEIDLFGDRLLAGENTCILGGSSENCRLKSTGLIGIPLISSEFSLPIRNITLECDLVLDLSGDSVTTALDWNGVNITDSREIGIISNYSNIILTDCAFLNSSNLTFDGIIGTVGFNSCLFNGNSGDSIVILSDSLEITRRFRIIYSSFVTLSGETGIEISSGTQIPTESFILDTVNFSGGGTYVDGLDNLSNTTLYINCVGIKNTSVHGQMYMKNNATPTVISNTTDYFKVLGTTAYSDNEKFAHSNNRLTCQALIQREYKLQLTCSFTSGNNNEIDFAFYNSSTGAIIPASVERSTANTSGRAENVCIMTLAALQAYDYIEVWVRNTSASNNVTVTHLNVIINQI